MQYDTLQNFLFNKYNIAISLESSCFSVQQKYFIIAVNTISQSKQKHYLLTNFNNGLWNKERIRLICSLFMHDRHMLFKTEVERIYSLFTGKKQFLLETKRTWKMSFNLV